MNGLRNRKDGETRLWIGRVIDLVVLFSAYSFFGFWFIGFLLDFRRLPFSRR
jgi:hypothetical protein